MSSSSEAPMDNKERTAKCHNKQHIEHSQFQQCKCELSKIQRLSR
jgi:hypothetical protein